MTISVDLPKFKTRLKYQAEIGYREREVEFDIQWVSCGVYQMSYYRPKDAKEHYILVAEDWYPPDTSITFTPEQFEKVYELYPNAPKNERPECYKPFYEEYDLSRGMFDFGDDCLFQAHKDPRDERVYLVNQPFLYGAPTPTKQVLGLYWEDFLRLKELLDSKKDEIFYSSCKISWPSVSNKEENK
jgi:hypothetical protein